jgi:nucleoprotein TPR
MASADVDVGYLAAHLGLPEQHLSTVTTDPTAELVWAVLAAVAAKAHEHDALYSQKLQLEVEFETSVRGAEAQRDASNETAKKAQKDVEEIRQKLKQEGMFL